MTLKRQACMAHFVMLIPQIHLDKNTHPPPRHQHIQADRQQICGSVDEWCAA